MKTKAPPAGDAADDAKSKHKVNSMTKTCTHVNGATAGGLAQLANTAICLETLQRAMARPTHLPGLCCFYGPSGYGKTSAAAVTAGVTGAYYVECKSTWTRKALLASILKEMGLVAAKTIYAMGDQVAEQLALSGRPLIIDEMDHIVAKGAVEIIRDIYEGSKAAILLIGEEGMPHKLLAWERFHGRILSWEAAQPATVEDARALARLYCKDVEIADDLLARITEAAKGSVRRVCVNLERVKEDALAQGLDTIDLAVWGDRQLFDGRPPKRRVQ